MGIWDRTTGSLASVVVVLLMATVAAHRLGRPATDGRVLRPAIKAAEIASLRVDEQYRASAADLAPAYDATTLAGSGDPGVRDGEGLYARFSDPVDVSVTPDGRRLLVLDGGGSLVREVSVDTRMVSTLLTPDTVAKLTADGRRFSRILALPGGMLLLDATGTRLLYVRPGMVLTLSPASGAPSAIADLILEGGAVLALERGTGRLFRAAGDDLAWSGLGTLPAGSFTSICSVNGTIVAASGDTGDVISYRVGRTTRTAAAHLSPGVQQLLPDPVHRRCLATGAGNLSIVSVSGAGQIVAVPAPLFNVQGRPLGSESAPFGYRTSWLTSSVRLAVDPASNTIYAADRGSRRITRMLDSFVGWKYNPAAGNPGGFYSADVPASKPAGTTRILWLSDSVFWSPAGVEEGNLSLSAPRQLEDLLNAAFPAAGTWQVLNPALTGTEFYTTAYPRTQRALGLYGLDYAVVVLDLQNLYWFLEFSGYNVPAAFDAQGAPIGPDAQLAAIPWAARRYPEPLRPLAEYITAHMTGPGARTPLLQDDGTIVPQAFLRAWAEDATFRSLLAEVYTRLIVSLQRACAAAGVKLSVVLAPTSNFIAPNEWVDAYAMGGTDGRYGFEAVHRPLLEGLWVAGVPAYDLTYDMLARHPRLFPFNASSHHRSDLFHRAVAESIVALARRFNLFSFEPMPARNPAGRAAAAVAPREVIVTERDLWEPGKAMFRQRGFPDLLSTALDDVDRDVAARAHACQTYDINFVLIKNRDDYGNRDLRSIDEVASMKVRADQRDALRSAVQRNAASEDLQRQVQFRTRRR
jgi:hypothetical protein